MPCALYCVHADREEKKVLDGEGTIEQNRWTCSDGMFSWG